MLFATVVLLGVGLGIFFYFQKGGGGYRAVEALDPGEYYENANSLRGNVYQVEGSIGGSLGWNPTKGRLFSLIVREGDRDWALPIFIPHDLQALNIQKRQTYQAKVKVNDQGVLLVTEMFKP